MEHGGDLVDDTDLPDTPEGVGQLRRQADDVVLADGHDLHRGRVLVVEDVGAHVVRDQLLGVLMTDGDRGLKKLRHLASVGLGRVEKVNSGWKKTKK